MASEPTCTCTLSFASLCQEISKISPRPSNGSATAVHGSEDTPRALCVLRRWTTELRRRFSPLPPNTTTIFFRFLFPEKDHRRKYDMQERALALYLSRILCVNTDRNCRGTSLKNWSGDYTLGCLGEEVRKILEQSSPDPDCLGVHSFKDIDNLLDELAATSAFTCLSLRRSFPEPRRSREAILRLIYGVMPALDAAIITQVILKDLQPLLYPVTETHFSTALKNFNSDAFYCISKEAAMSIWDPSGKMLGCYRVRSTLDEASNQFEEGVQCPFEPKLGIPINIPKCIKGQSCIQALMHFCKSDRIWAETKYDGERMQIHVEIDRDNQSKITIYSKSQRDSTLDRIATHWIIREALGLPQRSVKGMTQDSKDPKNVLSGDLRTVILEAEMVAFSNQSNRIDEFWRIRKLIESSAYGVRGTRYCRKSTGSSTSKANELNTQQSSCSDHTGNEDQHLALVFFDILYMNSSSLLTQPYSSRRSILESIIHLIPSFVFLADRQEIDISGIGGMDKGVKQLKSILAATIADHQEGLVLKATDGGYADKHSPWVKLKKDYIPGYGDSVDLVVIAAGWDKNRARQLRVPPTTYTTFYVGVLSNPNEVKYSLNAKPHFEVYFTVSYGLDRDHLEELNYLIRSSEPVKYDTSSPALSLAALPYTFHMSNDLSTPRVLLSTPLLVELFGAGFTKAPQGKYYELRFPRMTKVHRSSERIWTETVCLDALQQIARESVGQDRPHKDIDDWCKNLWGKTSSPRMRTDVKRKATELSWLEKLESADPPSKSRRIGLAGKVLERKLPGSLVTSENVRHHSLQGPVSRFGTPPKVASEPIVKQPVRSATDTHPLVILDRNIPSAVDGNNKEPECWPFRTSLLQTSMTWEISRAHIREAVTIKAPVLPCQNDENYSDITFHLSRHPMVQFMATSFVWMARPVDACRPAARPTLAELVSPDRQLHSFHAFLTGCGWAEEACQHTFDFINYGVIFIDTSKGEPNWWSRYAMTELSRKEKTEGAKRNPFRKPIWVFDSKIIEYEALQRVIDEGDLTAVEANSLACFV